MSNPLTYGRNRINDVIYPVVCMSKWTELETLSYYIIINFNYNKITYLYYNNYKNVINKSLSNCDWNKKYGCGIEIKVI